jgi:hypothetical protein
MLMPGFHVYYAFVAFGDWVLGMTGYSYTILSPVTTKAMAESACEARNAELASLRTIEEEDLVFSFLATMASKTYAVVGDSV